MGLALESTTGGIQREKERETERERRRETYKREKWRQKYREEKSKRMRNSRYYINTDKRDTECMMPMSIGVLHSFE